MSGDVALTASLRQNLTSIQRTTDLLDRTSQRLSTGKEVNSVFDDPVNFSRAQAFSDRASDLDRILDGISQSKRTVEQAQSGADAVESLIDSAESLVNQAEQELGQGSDSNASITGGTKVSETINADINANSPTTITGDPELNITANNSDGKAIETSIALTQSTGEQLVADINNATDTVNASLGEDGKLQLKAVNDGSLRISFGDTGLDSASIPTGASSEDIDQAIANALGIDNVVQQERQFITASDVSADLAGNLDDLTAIIGSDGDTVGIKSATGITENITIEDGESAQEFVDAVNNTSITSNVRAELNNGRIRLSTTDGSALSLNDSTNTALDSLGFDVGNNASTSETRLAATASQGTNIVGTFTDSSGNPLDLSDTIGNSKQVSGDGKLIVEARSEDGNSIGSVEIDDFEGQSIASILNKINNNIGEQIRASYDQETGKFTLTNVNENVAAVNLETTEDSAGPNNTLKIDAGFDGLSSSSLATLQIGTSEVDATGSAPDDNTGQLIRFGTAAGKLGQIEQSFNDLRGQIDSAVKEAELAGTNLLNGDNLETFFNVQRTESLLTEGVNFTAEGLDIGKANFTSAEKIQEFREKVVNAREDVRQFSSRITTDLNVISTRRDFAEKTQQTLNAAADDLTLADQNEEAAKLSALQTRQQLANQSLSIAVQSQQSVLQLLR